ncbi:MAG: thioredoxin domain-containing protein, partial [Steroidobacteraceae bacterium]
AELFAQVYDVTEHGNWEDTNILNRPKTYAQSARLMKMAEPGLRERLREAKQKLLQVRSQRVWPGRDEKILTAWNGLMIAAFARVARMLGATSAPGTRAAAASAGYLASATRAASFVRDRMWNASTRTLLRRYRAGQAAIDAYAEDYAFLVAGLLELFQADPDPAWLEWAVALQEAQDARFWDEADAGWFSTTGGDPSVLLRLKEEYDGAEPAPGSVATLNSIVLAHLTGRREFTERAERTLARYGPRLGEAARALPFMMAALATWHAGIEQIVVVGQSGAPDTEAMRAAVARRYRPFAVVIPVEPGERQKALAGLLPFIGPMTMRDGRATTYVCREFMCQEPVTDPAAFGA